MKKWKFPDWRNPEEYPDMGRASLHRWYWEFLRRREDYQVAFWKYAQETYDAAQELKDSGFGPYQNGEIIKPDEPGFTATIPSCWENFYVTTCPNPSEDNPHGFHYSGRKTISMVYGDLGLGETKEIATDCEVNEVLLKFDLDRPVHEQLKQAESMLKQWQSYKLYKQTGKENNKLPQTRRHTGKWINYLRALDARYQGETLEEIGLVVGANDLSEQGLEDRLFESGSKKLKSTGQEYLKSAKEVQFNFPF